MDKLPISEEKMNSLLFNVVLNSIEGLIRDYILKELENKKSFAEIGKQFELNRSTIFKIYTKSYFPKKKIKKIKLLNKYLELI